MYDNKPLNIELEYNELFPNYGYLITQIPNILLRELNNPIDNLKQDFTKGLKYNNYLVGEIKHEYSISLPQPLKKYIQSLVEQLEKKSNYIKNHKKFSNFNQLKLNIETWVNFQQKHEYNPLHNHSGIFSFVIWYKIPYLLEEENKYSPQSTYDTTSNGNFFFVCPHPNISTSIRDICLDVDKTKEGYIAIFPSSLYHVVYPFYTSDEYRITIAGVVEPS